MHYYRTWAMRGNDLISNKAFAAGYLGGGLLLQFIWEWYKPRRRLGDSFCHGILWTQAWIRSNDIYMVPEPHIENEMEPMGIIDSTKVALGKVKSTLADIKSFKTLFIYMIAYFCFIDGINSVTALAGVFGVVVLGLTATDLIITILIIQFVAAPAAIGFTKLAEKWGTKKALQFSLVCWCVVIVGALSFAPLELEKHDEYDIQYSWDDGKQTYVVEAREGVNNIAALPEDDEQIWALEYEEILPVEENDEVRSEYAVKWAIDDDGKSIKMDVNLTAASIKSLKSS